MDKLEILPIKNITKPKKTKIPDPLPKPPFTLSIVAPTKSGKTVTIANMIYRWFKPEFDEIIYISPTINIDKTLENNIKEDDEIVKISDKDDLKNIDDILEELSERDRKSTRLNSSH